MVTALAPHIGYELCSSIAHEAQETGKTVRDIVLERKIMTVEEVNRVLNLKEMTVPGIIDEEHLRS